MGIRPKTLPDGRNPLYAWDYRNQMTIMIEDIRPDENMLTIDFNSNTFRIISGFHRIPCDYIFNQPREIQNEIMNAVLDYMEKDCEIFTYEKNEYRLKHEAVEKAYSRGMRKAGMTDTSSLRARRVRFIFDSERFADKFVERFEWLCSTPSPKGGLSKVYRTKFEKYKGRSYEPSDFEYIADLFLTGENRNKILKSVAYEVIKGRYTSYHIKHFKVED